MSSVATLAPDQRAVLELVLRQGRSYGALAALLGIAETDVRARAAAGLRALAGEPGAGVDGARVTDWLLGQQPPAEAERTRAAVGGHRAAREWAAVAAGRLRELGGDAVPPVPAARSSSRLGGAVLIGIVVVVIGGVLAAVLIRGGEEASTRAPAPSPAAEPAGAGAGAGANDVLLSGESGAQGILRLVSREDGTVQFVLAADGVPPNRGQEVYAIWFTRDGGEDARRLGFAQTQVGADGILTTGGPQRGDEDRFPRWFATYDRVIVTRESAARTGEPGPVVLAGTLPRG